MTAFEFKNDTHSILKTEIFFIKRDEFSETIACVPLSTIKDLQEQNRKLSIENSALNEKIQELSPNALLTTD